MFCSQCGTYNDKAAEVCIKCGTKLGLAQAPAPVVQAEQVKAVPVSVTPVQESPVPTNPVQVAPAAQSMPVDIPKTVPMPVSGIENKYQPEKQQKEEKSEPVREYIMWSIISAILFSIPFGTAAVIFSGFTNTERCSGNTEKAKLYSQKTKFFCKISTALACVKAVAGLIVLAYFTPLGSFLSNLLPF